jgi:hypothetical protein
VNVDNVSRDDWIVGGVALLLVIDLLFLPWFSISLGTFGSASLSATSSPDGWLGILAMLASLAVLIDLAVERCSPQTHVPSIGGSRESTRFILALAVAAFLGLKFLFHIHFSIFGFGFYFAVILVIALVYFTMQARNASPLVPRKSAGRAGPPAA